MTEPDNIQGDNVSKESPSQSVQQAAAQQAAAQQATTPYRPGENSDLVFYYSSSARRERRASLLEQNTNTRWGFAKRLIGSRGNLFLLISILGIFLIFILGNRASLNREQGGFILGQNTVTLSVIEEEELLYLFVHKRSPSRTGYTGPVDISVAPVLAMGEGEPVFVTQRLFFSNKSQEAFRFALPFESDGVMVILKTENETIMRTIKKGP